MSSKTILTVLAFDYGLRQIGIAVGNCLTATTQPLTIIKAKDGIPQWPELEKLLTEWRPDLLIVGDPLNMDGTDGAMGERARKFARRLHGRFGHKVEMVDERLTSYEAKQDLQDLGHRGDYKASPVDSYAAELILQTWMRETGRL
ncbi:MAG: Holliday junction resolvase RuvX [Halioglobus sp.]